MVESETNKNYIIYILIGLLLVAAFAVGSLYTKVKYLEKGVSTGNSNTPSAAVQNPTPIASSEVSLDQVRDAFNKSLVKFGDAKKKLLFIEVADPSCPYCSIAVGLNGELNKQAGDRFKLVADGGTYVAPVPEMKKLVDSGRASFAWLYTPGHGSGEMGTKAMYCAFEKGKFWEVHDKLMTSEGYDLVNNIVKNDKSKSQELANFLKSVFTPSEMKKCLDSGKYDSQLQADINLATSLGIQGTPGFLINKTKYSGAYSYKDMEASVKNALE